MLKIGWASKDMTPARPAMLQGQMHVRVAREAMDPLTVTALALEGGVPVTRAMLISVDITCLTTAIRDEVIRRLAVRVPEVPADSVIMLATHTHASFVTEDGFYTHPGGDVMTPGECSTWVAEKAAEAAVEAWERRAPGVAESAFGHAVVGHNRRSCYADGRAVMYGKTNDPDFMMIEGAEDSSLDMLFTWDTSGRLLGVALAVPCPSQVDEHISLFSADYWHEVRTELRRRLGGHLSVLAMCGAAGDQSPHGLLRTREEAEMRRRSGRTERQEIACRVADAVERALACTRPPTGAVSLVSRMRRQGLTRITVTRSHRDWAEQTRQQALQQGLDSHGWWPTRLQHVVDSFDKPHHPGLFEVAIQTLRIGDLALVATPFELYLDYGQRIKARSPAPHTMTLQLSAGLSGKHLPIDGGFGWYLPTARALAGGSYGANPSVACVGPEGGQELVEATLAELDALFPDKGRQK
jgi:hypothetical protein